MTTTIEVQRFCEYCGNEFTARTTKTRYCSHACNSKAYKENIKTVKVISSNRVVQQIRNKPIEELKTKPFLSIVETCTLLGISRRTVYRMMDRGELNAGKAGKRTIIQRSEIDNLFIKA